VYAFWLPGGDGSSETALGDIVRRNHDRANVLIATKGGHPSMKGYERPDDYLSPRQINKDIADSLERLGLDSIDLYYLHRDDVRVPVSEIIDALHDHVTAGRLRAIGVSNWSVSRIAEANAYAAARGKTPFVASQPKFNLAVPRPSKDPLVPTFCQAEIDWHATQPLTVFAYTSTAGGYFATNGAKGAGGVLAEPSQARLRAAQRVAEELAATPTLVALAWLMRQPFKVVPILGTTNVDHLQDALHAAEISLSDAQFDLLTKGLT
jgi:aryl-alcohol dehydrogenase-like predicted oxidoreductase